jgi:hypothetical protein
MVLAGNEASEIKTVLQNELSEAFRSNNPNIRGSLDKTITILMKIWAKAPKELHFFQKDGLNLLTRLTREIHIAIHWGMTMSVYPFWGAIATHTGRLIRLQGTVAASHIQRRVKEQYGERETVSRSTQRILRSFIDWGVLNETTKKGVYIQGKELFVRESGLISWLIESLLHTRSNGTASFNDLLDHPAIFPFKLAHISAENVASKSSRLNILRQGLDKELVILDENYKLE